MTNNLSDIFKAYDIRGITGEQLTPLNLKNIAKTYADWLPKSGIIAVGHDMRTDSKELSASFIKGLTEQGYNVWDIGLVTSDMIYFAVGKWDLSGGAVITASHNPDKYNGIKLYRDGVIAVGLDSGLSEIRDNFLSNKFKPRASTPGTVIKKFITPDWIEHCLGFADKINKFNVAIDAGNGMAGAILPNILPKLPIKAEGMYFELDGNFPNHEANPQIYENLSDLISVVKEKGYDFGIAFDGDGDRAVFVDDLGTPVLGTDLITAISRLYLHKFPGAKIVHDVRTSRATTELIKRWGGHPVRTKAGRVSIGKVMREVGAPFGGETTGHMFYRENYDADSGLITALVTMQALSESGKKLSELVNEYRLYKMIPEKNIETNVAKETVFSRLRKEFSDGEIDDLDGITINYPSKWFNLRASNTEPLMRLNAEAESDKELYELIDRVIQLIR